MSSDYRMNLIWSSHGEQLRADLEANIGGLTGMRGEMQRGTTQMGLWGQQIRAVGTTLRYMFAGAVVYGVVTAVNALSTFESKLGDIEGLAAKIGSDGKVTRLGGMLDDLGDNALKTSNKFGIAVTDIEDYMARFYSSFEPKGTQAQAMQQATRWATDISALTRALGGEVGDPGQLAGGIAGLIHGIPGGTNNIHAQTVRISDIISYITQRSPVITGKDITRDIGRLGAAQVATGMSPEQIFSVYGAASLKGGSPAVIGRGITQLLAASLMNPKTAQNKAAFRDAGLPSSPNALRAFEYKGTQGGMAVLLRMMDAIFPKGASRKTARLLADESVGDVNAISGARGVNLNLAYRLYGRQESLRQVLALLSGGSAGTLDFVSGTKRAERQNLTIQRANIVLERSTLQLGTNAQRNLTLQLVRGFDPVLHSFAKAASWISDAVVGHRTAASATVMGAAGAQLASRVFLGTGVLGLAGRGLLRIPGIGRVMSSNPALRGIFGSAAAKGGAMSAAALVGSGLGAFSSKALGTRTDPYWVVIDPLSWFMPGAPSGLGGGGNEPPGTNVPKVIPPWMKGLGGATLLIATPVIAKMVKDEVDKRAEKAGKFRAIPKGHPLLDLFGDTQDRATGMTLHLKGHGQGATPSAAQKRILDAYRKKEITADQAEARLSKTMSRTSGGRAGGSPVTDIQGTVEGSVKVEATPELKKLLKVDTHIAVKFWPPTQAASGTRGKKKNIRGKAH